MPKLHLIGKDGKRVGEALQPVFRGQREFYFKVLPETPRTPDVFEFLHCKDGHVLWVVPFDKVLIENEEKK